MVDSISNAMLRWFIGFSPKTTRNRSKSVTSNDTEEQTDPRRLLIPTKGDTLKVISFDKGQQNRTASSSNSEQMQADKSVNTEKYVGQVEKSSVTESIGYTPSRGQGIIGYDPTQPSMDIGRTPQANNAERFETSLAFDDDNDQLYGQANRFEFPVSLLHSTADYARTASEVLCHVAFEKIKPAFVNISERQAVTGEAKPAGTDGLNPSSKQSILSIVSSEAEPAGAANLISSVEETTETENPSSANKSVRVIDESAEAVKRSSVHKPADTMKTSSTEESAEALNKSVETKEPSSVDESSTAVDKPAETVKSLSAKIVKPSPTDDPVKLDKPSTIHLASKLKKS